MKKNHFSGWLKELRIGHYLRELSVVIIGVAITLFVSNVISTSKEKNDLKLQLSTIHLEMEDNLKKVDLIEQYYQRNKQLRTYLLQSVYDPQPTTLDSIRMYQDVAWNVSSFTVKRAAYDMFINSGSMKLLNDKELLLNITECYSMLESLIKEHENRMNIKMRVFEVTYEMDKEMIYDKDADILSPHFKHIFNYQALNSGMEDHALETKLEIEKLLSGKLKDYRQTN